MPCFSPSSTLRILAAVNLLLAFCSAVHSLPNVSRAIRLPTEPEDGDGTCAGVSRPGSCPVSCFRTEPVCGVDGVTYWCGCEEAMCAGTRVAKLGFCEVGNGGSGSFPGQALLLVHIVWLILLGFSVLCGIF